MTSTDLATRILRLHPPDSFSCLGDDLLRTLQFAHPAHNVKAIGMKGLDFHKISGIAEELNQPRF